MFPTSEGGNEDVYSLLSEVHYCTNLQATL